MYKYFSTKYGTDCVSKISELRKDFPDCKFASGIWKGTRGIYAFSSDTKEYGEHYTLDDGNEFWNPTAENIENTKANLSKFKTDWVDRIKVKLKVGIELDIFPASAVPRKVLLARKKMPVEDTPYNKQHKYGLMAYNFYFKSQNNAEIKLDDQEFQDFIRLSLKESYKLPIEVWDAMEIISIADFDALFAAAMGFDIEMLNKEMPKSSGQS